MSDVSSNPLQLIEQTEMKPLIEGCVKKALLSYCKGTPAKIPWPHRVLHDAVRRIEELESELAAAKAELTRAPVKVGYVKKSDAKYMPQINQEMVLIVKGLGLLCPENGYQPIYIDKPKCNAAHNGEEG